MAYQGGWYDFTVTVSADSSFSRHFVGTSRRAPPASPAEPSVRTQPAVRTEPTVCPMACRSPDRTAADAATHPSIRSLPVRRHARLA
ncbi:hypothetical protein ABZ876_32015 [Streptomyces sp. NPDC046931]|uniref:hypothetical protein n=1 Tax=Streptomyces sp. NPDC046931 TaxID=3154806 RepID=UPI0033F96AAF